MDKWKKISILEVVVIILILIIIPNYYEKKMNESINKEGLLSQRVYTGILAPRNHLIFNLQPLEKGINDYIKSKNATIGVYIVNLRDGASIDINEELEFKPASINKLLIAILILRKVENGKLNINDKLPITSEDADTISGNLYLRAGEEVKIEELLREMLSKSDNTAVNVLAKKINTKELDSLSTYLNYNNPNNKESSEDYNKVTPKSTGNLFTSLYLSTLLEPKDSEYILKQLINTTFNIKAIADIPENVVIAQKFGIYHDEKVEYLHDCGIMYIDSARFFYCVMTKDLPSQEAQETIGTIVHAIYQYIVEERLNLDTSPPI